MILYLILNAIALYLTARWVPGIRVKNHFALLVMAVVVAGLNLLVRPILFILTLPLTILTLGLFILILNGIIFWLAANLVKDYQVEDLFSGTLGWIVFSILSFIFQQIFI